MRRAFTLSWSRRMSGERAASVSAVEVQNAEIVARIEVVAGKVADFDKQIAQLDAAIAAATTRGKANAGLSAVEGQRKARVGLASERNDAASTLWAALKAERASLAAPSRRIETEAAPIRYVAELAGADADSEKAIRWLIALMVLCCDPLAIALTGAASAPQSTAV
jgi:hypothetical protein